MLRRKRMLAGALLLASCLLAGVVNAQTIDFRGNAVYLDYDVDVPALEVRTGQVATLEVYASLSGQVTDGMIGAEFGITGLPSGWFLTLTKAPAVDILGESFRGPRRHRVSRL